MEREIFNHRATAVSLGSEARAGGLGSGDSACRVLGVSPTPGALSDLVPDRVRGVKENLGPTSGEPATGVRIGKVPMSPASQGLGKATVGRLGSRAFCSGSSPRAPRSTRSCLGLGRRVQRSTAGRTSSGRGRGFTHRHQQPAVAGQQHRRPHLGLSAPPRS